EPCALRFWAVSVLTAISAAVLWFAGARSAQAVTVLKGEAVCTACVLHESQEHAPALRVIAGPSTNIYYLDRSTAVAALQVYFCGGPTAATAEGKARTEKGKRLFQAATVTIPEANRLAAALAFAQQKPDRLDPFETALTKAPAPYR